MTITLKTEAYINSVRSWCNLIIWLLHKTDIRIITDQRIFMQFFSTEAKLIITEHWAWFRTVWRRAIGYTMMWPEILDFVISLLFSLILSSLMKNCVTRHPHQCTYACHYANHVLSNIIIILKLLLNYSFLLFRSHLHHNDQFSDESHAVVNMWQICG